MLDILKGIVGLFVASVITLGLLTDFGAENHAPLGILKHVKAGTPLVVTRAASVDLLKAPFAKPSAKRTPITAGATLDIEAVKTFKIRRFARISQNGKPLGWISDQDLAALGVPLDMAPGEARLLLFLQSFLPGNPVFWIALLVGSAFTALAYFGARALDGVFASREAAAGRGDKPALAGLVHLPVLAGLVVGLVGCFYANRTAYVLTELDFQGVAAKTLLVALMAVLISVAWCFFQSLRHFEARFFRAFAFSGLMLLAFVGSFLLAFVAIAAVVLAVAFFIGAKLLKDEFDPSQHQGKTLACPVCGGVEKHFSGCANSGTRLANQPLE